MSFSKAVLAAVATVVVIGGAVVASFPLGLWNLSDEALERKYRTPASKFLNVDGVRIHYQDEGSGPVLLLIHGSSESLFAWDGIAEILKAKYRVVRLDLPDYGLSSADPQHRYSSEADAHRLDVLLDSLHIDKVTIGGASFGGITAFSYAATRPTRVERLILSSSAGAVEPDVSKRPKLTALESWLSDYYVSAASLRRDLLSTSARTDYLTPTVLQQIQDMRNKKGRVWEQRRRGVSAARDHKQTVAGNSDNPLLGEVRCPVLIVWGESNAALPPSTADVFARLLSHAPSRIVLLPGVGHKIEREAPRELAAAIDAFMTEPAGTEEKTEEKNADR